MHSFICIRQIFRVIATVGTFVSVKALPIQCLTPERYVCSDEIMKTGYDVDRCADGTRYSASCLGGFFDSSYSPNSAVNWEADSEVVPCCPGYYCSRTTTCMQPCSQGAVCIIGVFSKERGQCVPYNTIYNSGSSNFTCGGANVDYPCPSGYFCPDNDKLPPACPEGHYCPSGSIAPSLCSSFMYSKDLDYCPYNTGENVIKVQTQVCLWLSLFVLAVIYFFEARIVSLVLSVQERDTINAKDQAVLRKGRFLQRTDLTLSSIILDDVRVWRDGNLSFVIDFENPKRPVQFVQGVTAIVGLSGAGKSTLFDTLAGNMKSYHTLSGQVKYTKNHMPVTDPAKKSFSATYEAFVYLYGHRIAYVWQQDVFHEPLTVYETVYFSARIRTNFTAEECALLVQYWLNKLQLHGDIQQRPTSRLSGGQRKRVNVAMELVTDPLLLILDEPTSGLDTNTTEILMEALHDFAEGKGFTSIASQQVAQEAEQKQQQLEEKHSRSPKRRSSRFSRSPWKLRCCIPRIVLAVLHQPSHEVAQSFDRIIGVQARKVVVDGQSYKVGNLDLPPKQFAPPSILADGSQTPASALTIDPELYLTTNSRVQAVKPHRQNDMDNYLMSFLERPDELEPKLHSGSSDSSSSSSDDVEQQRLSLPGSSLKNADECVLSPTYAQLDSEPPFGGDEGIDDARNRGVDMLTPRNRAATLFQRNRSYYEDEREAEILRQRIREIPGFTSFSLSSLVRKPKTTRAYCSTWRSFPRYDTSSATDVYFYTSASSQSTSIIGRFVAMFSGQTSSEKGYRKARLLNYSYEVRYLRVCGYVRTFCKHYFLGATRGFALFLHKWDVFFVNATMAMALGYALGIFNTNLDISPQKVPSSAFLLTLTMSLVCLQTGLQSRLAQKIANARESLRGVHSVAVYLGESLVEMIWLVTAPAFLLLFFFEKASPRGSFGLYYIICLCCGFAAASVGHLLAEQSYWREPAPIGIYINLFYALLSGFTPAKRTLNTGTTSWSFLSFAYESLIHVEFAMYPPVLVSTAQAYIFSYEPSCRKVHSRDPNAPDAPNIYVDCNLECSFALCLLPRLACILLWGLLFRFYVVLMMNGYFVGFRDRCLFAYRLAQREVAHQEERLLGGRRIEGQRWLIRTLREWWIATQLVVVSLFSWHHHGDDDEDGSDDESAEDDVAVVTQAKASKPRRSKEMPVRKSLFPFASGTGNAKASRKGYKRSPLSEQADKDTER